MLTLSFFPSKTEGYEVLVHIESNYGKPERFSCEAQFSTVIELLEDLTPRVKTMPKFKKVKLPKTKYNPDSVFSRARSEPLDLTRYGLFQFIEEKFQDFPQIAFSLNYSKGVTGIQKKILNKHSFELEEGKLIESIQKIF